MAAGAPLLPEVALVIVVDGGVDGPAVQRVEARQPGPVIEGGRVVPLAACEDDPAVRLEVQEIRTDHPPVTEVRRVKLHLAIGGADRARRRVRNVVRLARVALLIEDDFGSPGHLKHETRTRSGLSGVGGRAGGQHG